MPALDSFCRYFARQEFRFFSKLRYTFVNMKMNIFNLERQEEQGRIHGHQLRTGGQGRK